MSLKDNWKQTGVGLGHAFRDLGKSVVKSVATGVKKVDNWANKEKPEEEKADSHPEAFVPEEVKEEVFIPQESEPVEAVEPAPAAPAVKRDEPEWKIDD